MSLDAVEILFINYNHQGYLQGLLDSLKSSVYPIDRTIMVDNGSTDGSVDFVRERFPDVFIIENKENKGFAAAANIGLRAAKGKYVCLVGPDVVVAADWLHSLMDVMKSKDNAIFCASKVLSMEDKDKIMSAGSSINYIGHMVLRHRFESEELMAETDPQKLSIIDSTSVLLDREKFEELGFLDEDLFLYYDEMDFCLRAQIMKGYECYYVPKAKVYHGEGSVESSFRGKKKKFPSFRAYLMTKNRWLVILKNYQLKTLFVVSPMLLFFELITIAFMIKNRNIGSYFRGIWWNIVNLPSTISKRRDIQRKRKVYDRELLSAEPLSINPVLHRSGLEYHVYRIINSILSGYWKLASNLL